MNGDLGPQGEDYTDEQVAAMYRRAWIAGFLVAALLIVVALIR